MKLFNHPLIGDRQIITKNIHNILVIQLGDIGDVVCTYPTIHAVQRHYPRARISLLLRSGRDGLFEDNPLVYKVHTVRKYDQRGWNAVGEQLSFLFHLRKEKFDLVIDLRGDDRGAFLARVTGAPIRLASYYKNVPFWRNRMFTHLAPLSSSFGSGYGPEAQSLAVVEPFGIDTSGPIPRFPIPESIQERVKGLLMKEELEPCNPWVSVSPFSRWSYKEWDYSKWVEVMQWLWRVYHLPVVIVGSHDEREKAAQMARASAGKVINFAGVTTLAELAGILRLSLLHMGVDTGGLHIAAAVGTPTITIYGPSYWDAWAHPGEEHRIVFPDMPCVPCRQTGCDNLYRSKCLDELEPKRVQEVIIQSLQYLRFAR